MSLLAPRIHKSRSHLVPRSPLALDFTGPREKTIGLRICRSEAKSLRARHRQNLMRNDFLGGL